MATYIFSSSGVEPNLNFYGCKSDAINEIPRFPEFIALDDLDSPAVACIGINTSSSNYISRGVFITYSLPQGITRFTPVTSIIIEFTTTVHSGNSDYGMYITIAGKKEPVSATSNFEYVPLITEDNLLAGTHQLDLTDFGIQPYGYLFYISYSPGTKYDVTNATVTIITNQQYGTKTYAVPLNISGYVTPSDSRSHTKDPLLTYYTTDENTKRIGASGGFNRGYGIKLELPTWLVSNSNIIYNSILNSFNNNNFSSLNPQITFYFTASANRTDKAAFGVLKGDNGLELPEDLTQYDLAPTGNNTDKRSSSQTISNWAEDWIDSANAQSNNYSDNFLNYGLGIGGGMDNSQLVFLYIQSAVLILEITDLNTVRVVNSQETSLDTYKVYIVENNTLVPYRVAIVNNQGTLDFYS